MKFDLFKHPSTEDVCMQLVIRWQELEEAYEKMHPLHRALLVSYFEPDSSAADHLFGFSEIVKVLEREE
jgi:hypothetical protein